MKKENKQAVTQEQKQDHGELKYTYIIQRLVALIQQASLNYRTKAKRRSPKRNKILNAIHDKITDLKVILNVIDLKLEYGAYGDNELEMEILKTIKFLKEQSKITKISHFNNSYFNFNFFCCRIKLTESRLAKEIDAILNDPIIKAAEKEILKIIDMNFYIEKGL